MQQFDSNYWRDPKNAKHQLLLSVARTANSRRVGYAISNRYIERQTHDELIELYATNSLGVLQALKELKEQSEDYVIDHVIHNLSPEELQKELDNLTLPCIHVQKKKNIDILETKKRLDFLLWHKKAVIVADDNDRTKLNILNLLNEASKNPLASIESCDSQLAAVVLLLNFKDIGFYGFSPNVKKLTEVR